MSFTEPTEGEQLTGSEAAAARQAFLSEPPEIYDNYNDPAPEPSAADEEAAALEELTKPSAPEGAQPAPSPAPVPTPTADPFSAFGGEEAVRTAFQVQEAMRTPEGVRALVGQGLIALGYSVENVRAALEAQPAEAAPAPTTAADPFAGLDDDDVVDVKTVRQLAAQVAQQAAEAAVAQSIAATEPKVKSVQEAVLAQQQQAVRTYTDSALIEVLGQPPTDPEALAEYGKSVDAIVQRGQAYYDPSLSYDPNHVRQAVQRAHAELEAEAEARFKQYLGRKKAARDSQPVNVGGGAGVEGALPEPKNMAEARQQARDGGFFK